jgi:hypothetical protein
MGAFINPLSTTQQWDEKPTGPRGRADGPGADGNSGADATTSNSSQGSPRKASVVIRASVEHVGLVGDTELTVSVKWPSSTFCVQPAAEQKAPASSTDDSQKVPANGPLASMGTLHGEAVLKAKETKEAKAAQSVEKAEEKKKE